MRRTTRATFGRRCLAAASWLSAALCVAVGVLWVCTWRVGRGVGFSNYPPGPATNPPQTWGEITSRRGSLAYLHVTSNYSGDYPRGPMRWISFRFTGDGRTGFFMDQLPPSPMDVGFRSDRPFGPYVQRTTVVIVPHWIILAAASVLPAWRAFLAVRRRRLSGQGKCVACGYDLRAGPGRCPECGMDKTGGGSAAT